MFLERKGWRDEVNVNLFHKALQSYKTRIENEIFLLENTTIPEPSPTEVCNSLLEKYGPGFEKIHS